MGGIKCLGNFSVYSLSYIIDDFEYELKDEDNNTIDMYINKIIFIQQIWS